MTRHVADNIFSNAVKGCSSINCQKIHKGKADLDLLASRSRDLFQDADTDVPLGKRKLLNIQI